MNFRQLVEEFSSSGNIYDLTTGETEYIELFKNPSLAELKSLERQIIKNNINKEWVAVRGLLIPYRIDNSRKEINATNFDKVDLYIWDGSKTIHDSILKHFKDKIGTSTRSKTFLLTKDPSWPFFRITNVYDKKNAIKVANLAEKKFKIGFVVK